MVCAVTIVPFIKCVYMHIVMWVGVLFAPKNKKGQLFHEFLGPFSKPNNICRVVIIERCTDNYYILMNNYE